MKLTGKARKLYRFMKCPCIAALTLVMFFATPAMSANQAPTIAILSYTDGLSADNRALTRGLNTIVSFKLESTPGIRVTPDTELASVLDTFDQEALWLGDSKAVRAALKSLDAQTVIIGRHTQSGSTVSTHFRLCRISDGKAACRINEMQVSKNNTAIFQKKIVKSIIQDIDKKLSTVMEAMPYTDNAQAMESFFRGIDLLASGRDADGFKALDNADKKDDAFRDLWYFLGKYYATEKFDYEKAISYLSRAIAKFPEDPSSYYWLGFTYYLQGATTLAISAFETSIEIKPATYEAHIYLAMLYKDLGQYDKVETHYIKALQYTPGNAAAWYNLAGIQAQMKKDDQATQSLARALELDCDVFLAIAKTDSDLATIRKNPNFQKLLKKSSKSCAR